MVMASDRSVSSIWPARTRTKDDQLGGLRMTREGLRQSDRLVIETVCAAGVPLVITLAGGYATASKRLSKFMPPRLRKHKRQPRKLENTNKASLVHQSPFFRKARRATKNTKRFCTRPFFVIFVFLRAFVISDL